MQSLEDIAFDAEAAEELAAWAEDLLTGSEHRFDAARAIAQRLGASVDGDRIVFGFWTPQLQDWRIADGDIFVEVLRPEPELDLCLSHAEVEFARILLPVTRCEAFVFSVASGIRAGRRDRIGDFYALLWRDAEGQMTRILDPLAMSLPYGAFAPAEVYDTAAMQAAREDVGYYRTLASAGPAPHKFTAPTSILQLHVPTATAGGTLASLTRHIRRLGERVEKDLPLEPDDELFLGYDAVQPLPVDPTTVFEAGPAFWAETEARQDALQVSLTRPNTTNWGYDVVIAGMATVNPTLLETARPDELVDLAAALHSFPGKPKMLILDVVYGHSDNQGLDVLASHYFAGPNMYGQNIDYRNPFVRAILQEMQRRKVDFGADGVRVDGAQDFKWWDTAAQELHHDDDYLQEMSDIVQEVAGTRFRPWFVFEDGRPWPEEDWELSSTYRAVIETQRDADVYQWGPLTFAHNTPFIYTYWLSKYWRIREILAHGENWISGTANHDTLRRGTQVSPKLNINTRLGATRMEILDKAYDNPAVSLLTYAVFPGVPMDFLNATARASWGFIRNQDDRYGVKVVAEEAISLKWQVDGYSYSVPGHFRRLKELGFETREDLARFFEFLPALVEVTDYDLATIATLLNAVAPKLAGPELFTIATLKEIARAWMDDMHEYCNVTHSTSLLDPGQTGFMRTLREFRLANPWLRMNFQGRDSFRYLEPIDGRTVFAAHRHAPDGRQVFVLCHMEGGETEEILPLDHLPAGTDRTGWRLVLRSPGIGSDYLGGALVLRDSMGLVFERP